MEVEPFVNDHNPYEPNQDYGPDISDEEAMFEDLEWAGVPGPLKVAVIKGKLIAAIDDPEGQHVAIGRASDLGMLQLLAAAPELYAAVLALTSHATDSFCEWCGKHAPKDDEGQIESRLIHRDGCAYVTALNALHKARGQ